MYYNYKEIKNYMKNNKKHWAKKDIENILNAKKTGDWNKVKKSKLYNAYGGEYCKLLEAIEIQKDLFR